MRPACGVTPRHQPLDKTRLSSSCRDCPSPTSVRTEGVCHLPGTQFPSWGFREENGNRDNSVNPARCPSSTTRGGDGTWQEHWEATEH